MIFDCGAAMLCHHKRLKNQLSVSWEESSETENRKVVGPRLADPPRWLATSSASVGLLTTHLALKQQVVLSALPLAIISVVCRIDARL